MTYLLMSPMERPKGWDFKAYMIYLKFNREALLAKPKSEWTLTRGEAAFVAYADVTPFPNSHLTFSPESLRFNLSEP